MAQRLLLVNPSPSGAKSRRRKTTARRKRANSQIAKGRKPMAKRRTAAQKRATRKMIAANRARARSGRRAPTKARRRVRRNPATKYRQRKTYARTATMNPRRRRRSPVRARRRSTARRVRRNPIRMQNVFRELLQPAAIGAVGAIANDAMFTYLPIPVQFKTPGFARYASKGISAVAMTWLASYVVKRDTAAQLGIGALTQLSAEIFRNFIAQNVPALAPAAMEGMGYYNPATVAGGGIGYYTDQGMSMYVPGGGGGPAQLPSQAPSLNTDNMGMYTENGYSYN